jgi:hypothetical protein
MTHLEHAEGFELLPVLLMGVARDAGIRVLLIKGAATNHHGLRPPKLSNDVDVLVEPAGFDAYVAALGALGWVRKPLPYPSFWDRPHSETFHHDQWPLELDVHRFFPGFLHDPAVVFDLLWAERSDLSIATQPIPATGFCGSALIAALHRLRDAGDSGSARELALVAAAVANRGGKSLAQIAALARQAGAEVTAGPLLEELGLPTGNPDVADRHQLALWWLHDESGRPGARWILELRRNPKWRWPAIIWHGLSRADQADIQHRYGTVAPGVRGRLLVRWWRIRDTVPRLPRVIKWLRQRPIP